LGLFNIIETLIIRFIVGIILNIPVLIWIIKKQYLTWPGGILAGGSTGLILFILNPFFWLSLLVFFISSSTLSKFKYEQKKDISLNFSKSSKRDSWQVIANSFGAIFFGIISLVGNNFDLNVLFSSYSIAAFTYLAVMNADTWATELGTLSSENVYYILDLRRKVPPGTSGGISIIGTLSGFAGAALLALTATFSLVFNELFNTLTLTINHIIYSFLIIVISGFLGMILDSILGGTLQAMYYCPKCNKTTEALTHQLCGGTTTNYEKGIKWINNDVVNITAGLFSSLLAVFLSMIFLGI
jgi:uncharacterized protein (TIGR00297 family)